VHAHARETDIVLLHSEHHLREGMRPVRFLLEPTTSKQPVPQVLGPGGGGCCRMNNVSFGLREINRPLYCLFNAISRVTKFKWANEFHLIVLHCGSGTCILTGLYAYVIMTPHGEMTQEYDLFSDVLMCEL